MSAGAAPWSLAVPDVLAAAGVTEAGLDEREAVARLQDVGPNRLREVRRVRALVVLLGQFKSLIIVLLVAAAVLSIAVGDLLEGAAIAVTIALTITLGFLTELRAVRSMEALRKLGSVRARVRRDGVERAVDAVELVPGDIVLFEGGDRITADVRVVEASKLKADESALTGESISVRKNTEPVEAEALPADRANMLYKGATVTRGAGAGVVVATGMATELGRIAELVDEAHHEVTPLERKLEALGRRLLWICLAIAAGTIVAGIVGGRPAILMIETGIALAVAAIPEGLPVVATVALARGMWRLASRHALINRLSAVETLGATSVIVTDKTGTLTENRMSVVALPTDADIRRTAVEIAALCNNASLAGDEPSGDPLEVALLVAAAAELDRDELIARYPEVREEAFDPEVKMMATVHRDDGSFRVAVKGAPESVLEACSAVRRADGDAPLADGGRDELLERASTMAAGGLRVLAVAEKSTATAECDVYAELAFVALLGLADPPRSEVAAPLATCRRAGIRVVMATGDQAATATSIARSVELIDGDGARVVHGSELAELGSITEERRRELLAAQVFARVTPEQKLDIIELHQTSGAVVAMTGDGVNDAPALRKADIGIAMGQRGTDVAREAAEMVLVDDSFDSIVVAVEQGRAIFENIRRFVVYLLSCNLSEVLIVAGAVAVGAPLPLLPLQILFLNLVTDVFPALALGFGEGDPGAMARAPRDAREALVTRRGWAAIATYSGLITASVLGAMALAAALGADEREATSVSFLTLGFAQLWHVFNMRGRGTSVVANDVVRNPWVWTAIALSGLLIAATSMAPLAVVLDVAPLSAVDWTIVIGMSAAPLVIGQVALGHSSRREPAGTGC